MLLAIDIGNTNIVIGCIEAEKICHELRLATDLVKTSDQYWMDLKGVLALYDLQADEIEGVIISSVVPPVLNSLRTAVMKLTGRTPMVVGPGLKNGAEYCGRKRRSGRQRPGCRGGRRAARLSRAGDHHRHGHGDNHDGNRPDRNLPRRQHLPGREGFLGGSDDENLSAARHQS